MLLPEAPTGIRREPILVLTAHRDTPAFSNIRRLNLCSKMDISKTVWINACMVYHSKDNHSHILTQFLSKINEKLKILKYLQ